MAISAGRIVAVGSDAELAALAGPTTRRIDAGGATVTPGLCDAHVHLLKWAHGLSELSLNGIRSRDEVLARVRAHLGDHPGRGVVVGRGWSDHGWGCAPDRASLDAVTGDRAVLLYAHDDHTLWVNSAALRAAGVTAATADPPGGRIERDASSAPTGIFREHAVRVFAELDRGSARDADAAVLARAVQRLHAYGITMVHDFENARAARALRAMSGGTGPRVRVLMHLTHDGLDDALRLGIESGVGDDWYRLGHVKLFADGTLGSRTAALLAPFDDTDEAGMDLIAPDELTRLVTRAFAGGLSIAVHAIGDRACRHALDAFTAAADAGRPELPPRIEHVQLLDPADRPRFAALGVVASVQPIHCTSDIDMAERWWRTRRDSAYPWRSLIDAGARLAFGSDAPIEAPDPVQGLHAALTRRRADGTPREGFVPAECVTLDEALTAYTEGPARMANAWPRIGRLAAGARADLVVWNTDLHGLPVERLLEAAPAATILDGRVVFQRTATHAPALEMKHVGAEGA